MITAMKNKYIIRSRISEAKFREILKYFCIDIEAVKIAKLSNISRQSVNKIFKQIKGISKNNLILHLKGMEFRYNTKLQKQKFIQKNFIFLIKNNPLKLN